MKDDRICKCLFNKIVLKASFVLMKCALYSSCRLAIANHSYSW